MNCAYAYAAASHADAWLAEHFQKQNALIEWRPGPAKYLSFPHSPSHERQCVKEIPNATPAKRHSDAAYGPELCKGGDLLPIKNTLGRGQALAAMNAGVVDGKGFAFDRLQI
ncbi:hypothetical protein [Desulfocurvibacter africanus]|uniref:hypothetical protein n=1 Tax=Desulfocurvibacter africanus TaxID=873 RepID=UPI001183A3EE|nr:hypothetical protein [Desulfocurvibacter africanus]